jgi:hypothetical protein
MVPSINATTQQKSPDSSPQSRSHPELNGEGKLPYNLPSSVTSQHVQFLFRKQAQNQLKAYDFELSKLDRNAQRAMELCDLLAADKYLSHAIVSLIHLVQYSTGADGFEYQGKAGPRDRLDKIHGHGAVNYCRFCDNQASASTF